VVSPPSNALTAAAPEPAVIDAAPQAASPPAAPLQRSDPVRRATPAASAAASASVTPAPATGITTPRLAPQPQAPAASAPVTATVSEPATAPPTTGSAATPADTAPASVPRVVNRVAPDIPPAALRRVGAFDELLVQLVVRADGTVAEASVLTPGMRPVEPYVVEALKQWRFEPTGQTRTQRMQLLFRDG
jgi:outer membrane biosynthesis protein TonB